MQQLRELVLLVLQLRQTMHDFFRSRRSSSGSSGRASPIPSAVAGGAPSEGLAAVAPERLVVLPRDRKCPIFTGRTGVGIVEWLEEVQMCARARYLSAPDQALFMVDHFGGEAREEIKFRSSTERRDPDRICAILKELYGCNQSYVTLQQAFFPRHQLEGETLQEFSLALLALMAQVKQHAPDGMPSSEVLLRDQFVEHVMDSSLRRELKQLVRGQPTATLLELRSEAIRWEREGLPGGVRGRSFSLLSAHGFQLFGTFGSSLFDSPSISQAPGPVLVALQKCHQSAKPDPKISTGVGEWCEFLVAP